MMHTRRCISTFFFTILFSINILTDKVRKITPIENGEKGKSYCSKTRDRICVVVALVLECSYSTLLRSPVEQQKRRNQVFLL